ncbi:o-succinylbenzoate synthase [Adhaeribacter pallidiroseus]|uniref:O-succinylbenzoate synthase n=1 Tax=Adhaeribacter pallidiroseus TaxID=2072847 RepID=A0A369QCK0_9BACT|nr:o-succinylbenzoate synthase [Adhaeribacter pallidiroseus]RDC62623.1 o-succinylbenzoate synthase [Adhaeribacter pallidiroseus]
MPLQGSVQKHVLQFKFDARTSRGAMQQHAVYYIKVWDTQQPQIVGVGECAPLPGLSPEYNPEFAEQLQEWITRFNRKAIDSESVNAYNLNQKFNIPAWPSLQFGFETAVLDWRKHGSKKLFDNYFSRSEAGIPINGLIWMGEKAFMQQQIEKKLQEGYSCLKLKIGSLDFKTELAILQQIREVAAADTLTIRLDANGAFTSEEAQNKLEQLAEYAIHSIEQPIKPQQPEAMAQLCQHSPIPVALDEELIGVTNPAARQQLLLEIKPAYLILKPTLLGGLKATKEWIYLAEEQKIDWWITSALESNIGLNAISQFTAAYTLKREQGLGTGQLYTNNINSPLRIQAGKLYYDAATSWDNLP